MSGDFRIQLIGLSHWAGKSFEKKGIKSEDTLGYTLSIPSPPGIPLNSILHISPKVLFLWTVHSIWSKGAHWALGEGSMVRVLAVKA